MNGGGTALYQNAGPGMNSASPIPQQWWDQDGNAGPPHGGHGHSAMDMAAHHHNPGNYRAASPMLSQRMEGMHMGGPPPGPPPGPPGGPHYGHYNPNNSNGYGAPMNGGGAPMPQPRGPSSNGLIRLTLNKPMGIVFEPMEDPHNPSQQRGVRICDLPHTGAAAMSGMLEVGDELLSINNKPMSRLTFDEIMDFIIDADAENVELLFRRQKRDKVGKAPEGVKHSSTVKWDDNVAPNSVNVGSQDEGTIEDSIGPKGKHGSPRRRDEESLYSADETFYTEQTDYTEDTRQKRRSKRRGRRFESESFLDLLIDTVCAPVMGGGDRGDYSDDDMTFNSMDEDTYASGDESHTFLEEKKKKWQQSRKKRSEREKRSLEEEKKKKSEKSKSKKFEQKNVPPPYDPQPHTDPYSDSNQIQYTEPQNPNIIGMPPQMNGSEKPYKQSNSPQDMGPGRNTGSPQRPPPAQDHQQGNLSPNRYNNGGKASSRFEPQGAPEKIDDGAVEPDSKVPFREITYDDREEIVSVMESVGGPSLLLENLRNANQMKRTVKADIIQNFGKDFKPDLGLTREESIQMNPQRFYKRVVKKMLEENEPEKVRLMDKLFDKYKGREEHLIRKLDARYVKNAQNNSQDKGKSESTDGDGGEYDGFKAFGGHFSKSTSESNDRKSHDEPNGFSGDGWQPEDVQVFQSNDMAGQEDDGFDGGFVEQNQNEDDHSSYTESDYESVDGTSPEVIAQVSELLNYVYGKTTVAGQIDRVSTIMRAYEGREAILLELLETKALLKANSDKGNLEDLPESLRGNPGLQQDPSGGDVHIRRGEEQMMSPISMAAPSSQVSAAVTSKSSEVEHSISNSNTTPDDNPFDIDNQNQGPTFSSEKKKKKKGIFGGMFKKKKGNKAGGAFPTNENGKKSRGKKDTLLGSQSGY